MSPNKRRMEIVKLLYQKRQVTMEELAYTFHVSVRTIWRDLDMLSADYPLTFLRGRYAGGVKMLADMECRPPRTWLTMSQRNLLERLARGSPNEEEKEILRSIIVEFSCAPTPNGGGSHA